MRAVLFSALLGVVLTSSPAAFAEEYVFVGQIGGVQGPAVEEFDHPYDVTIHQNRLYVADSHNNRVQVFDLQTWEFLFQWGSTGDADGEFARNRGIAATPFEGEDAAIYVTDAKNDRVQKFDVDGNHIVSWGSIGDGTHEFFRPRPVSVASFGVVVVGDLDNHRVKVHRPNLTIRAIFGTQGEGPGQFQSPHGLEVGRNGIIYVLDNFNSRVQMFNLDGQYQGEFGEPGTEPGQFVQPKGITIDAEGNLFITDSDHPADTFDRVQKFTSSGEYITSFGSHGSGPEELSLATGLVCDDQGRVFIADLENHRISVWAPRPVTTRQRSFSSFKAGRSPR